MAISPNSNAWALMREVEERQALLAGVEMRRANIEHLALYEGSYDRIYDEAVLMSVDLKRLKQSLKRLRDSLEDDAQ